MTNTISKLFLLAIMGAAAADAAPEIRKVTLFVNYGGPIHEVAIPIFKNTLTALAAEKGFQLTISEKSHTPAQKSAAIANLKSNDVVLFANTGRSSFESPEDQAAIEDYFMSGGKGIGFHASIDYPEAYWKWWFDLHSGGRFSGHGNKPFKLNRDPELSGNPALQKMWEAHNLGDPNITQTEIYTLSAYPRGKEGVTMMQVVAPPINAVPQHDFTWLKKIGSGEYIFTCLGHNDKDFEGGWLQKATWAWMAYLNGQYNTVGSAPDKVLSSNSILLSGKSLRVSYAGAFYLNIRNAAGAEVFSDQAQGERAFALTSLEPGYYFVRLEASSQTLVRRIFLK